MCLLAVLAPPSSQAATGAADGTGLKGEYYDNENFTGLKLSRTDPTVDFSWRRGSPAAPVASDTFSVRWTGEIAPRAAGTYTFYTRSDDGARLWVNDKLVIDGKVGAAVRERSGRITLQAGERYAMRVEYYEEAGAAGARLMWRGPGIPKQVVPKSQLYPPGSATPSATTGRMVFAHFMLCCGGVSNDVAGYEEDIRVAQAAGIDGFALNAGAWSTEPHYEQRADAMYQAAQELGTGFELFFSADMCCSIGDGQNVSQDLADLREMVVKYYDHPNQLKVNGKSMLSTFGGEGSNLGRANPTEGWKAFLDARAAEGRPVHFVPMFYPSNYSEHPNEADVNGIYDRFPYVDGAFYFPALAIGNDRGASAIASNRAYDKVSAARGKDAMAGAVPLYTPELGGLDGGNNRTAEYAGAEVMQGVWKNIIADSPRFVEIVTWNDHNERSYLGPSPNGGADASRFPHDAYRELSAHYIRWYKTGVEPPISEDKLFYFYRTHSKNATAKSPPRPKPQGWDSVQDRVHVTAMLKEPGAVRIVSGGTTQSFNLPAGISDISMPFAQGNQTVGLYREGTKLAEETGALPINNDIMAYNFNSYSDFFRAP